MTHYDRKLYDGYSCIALKQVLAAWDHHGGDQIRELIKSKSPESYPRSVALICFDIADAMMAERAKRLALPTTPPLHHSITPP